ncbi:MAG: DCC1-like thiol-disulfide oxidoreductase family protein [Woeseia sp.]
METSKSNYSFLTDASVPKFVPPTHFTVMDATCGFCAKGAAWIAGNDQARKFRIIPMQSELGSALMRHYGLDPADPSSWLYVRKGEPFTSMDAVIRVGQDLGGIWRVLGALRILPNKVLDGLYGLIARNRYRLMGRTDLCEVADPEVQKRLLR